MLDTASVPTPARTASGLSPCVIAALVVTVVSWSSAFIAIRASADTVSPGAMAFGRFVVASVLFAFLLLRVRWVRPTLTEWVLVSAFGVVALAGYTIALAFAEQSMDAGTAALLVNVSPVFVAAGGVLLFGERATRSLIFGGTIALLGATLTAIGSMDGRADLRGVVAALTASLAFAVGALLQKRLLRRLPAAQVMCVATVVAVASSAPFARDIGQLFAGGDLVALWILVFLGAVPTALGFTTWGYALSRISASQAGLATYLAPPVSVILSFVVLGELPTALAIAGGVLCIGGVAFSMRRGRRDSVPKANSAG